MDDYVVDIRGYSPKMNVRADDVAVEGGSYVFYRDGKRVFFLPVAHTGYIRMDEQ